MQYSSFFNAQKLPNGEFDRTYNATDWAKYFASFIGNGVFATPSNNLEVTAGTNMQVLVNTGEAFINGYYYNNTESLQVPIAEANGSYARITNIVLELDLTNREILIKAVDGNPAPSPVAPTLVQTEGIYQLCLAQINIPSASTSIVASNITDTRAEDKLCGYIVLKPHLDNIEELENNIKALQAMCNAGNGTFSGIQLKNSWSVMMSNIIQNNNGILWIAPSSNSVQLTNMFMNADGNINDNVTLSYNCSTEGKDTIDFNIPVHLNNGFTYNTPEILSGDDFNNYTTTGTYLCWWNAQASACSNCPSTYAGILEVTYGESGQFVFQTYTDFYGNVYYRSYYKFGGYWITWTQMASASKLTTLAKTVAQNTLNLANATYSENVANGTNFNYFVTTGKYFINTDTIASSCPNCPSPVAGYMIVEMQGNQLFLYQRYYDMSGCSYYRVYDYAQSSWTNWNTRQTASDGNVQMDAVATTLCQLSIENGKLKQQNKELGGQVASLTLQQAETNNKLKFLASTIVESNLHK